MKKIILMALLLVSFAYAETYEGEYYYDTKYSVTEKCFTNPNCYGNGLSSWSKEDFFSHKLKIKYKMWTLMGEPVIDLRVKYEIDDGPYSIIRIDGKDYKIKDFPKEVIDKLRIHSVKLKLPFVSKSQTPVLHIDADAGVTGKANEWSYNTPASSNWDNWIKTPEEKPLNKKDAIKAFKTFEGIAGVENGEIHSEKIVITWDVSAAKSYLLNKESNDKYPFTLNLKDENGKPIKDAKIYILNIKPKYTPGMMLKKGTYKVKVVREGYKDLIKEVELDKNTKPEKLTFALTKSAPKKLVDVWIDEDTNLMWQNEEYSQKEIDNYKKYFKKAKAVAKTGDWYHAKSYCSNLKLNGFSNWKLPTIEELEGVRNKRKNFKQPNDTMRNLWASTSAGSKKLVYSFVGYDKGKDIKQKSYPDAVTNFIRCVRDNK